MTSTSSRSSNVFIFHGEDDFSIQRKVRRWISEFEKKYSTSAVSIIDGEKLGEDELGKKLEQELSPSLFATKKLLIAKNVLPNKATQESLAEKLRQVISNTPKDYFLVFWQSVKLDQRLKVVKKILSLPVQVTQFKLPVGKALNQWLISEAEAKSVTLTPAAADRLAVFLGRDEASEKKAPPFNLWQADNELSKLASYKAKIEQSDVEKLVEPHLPENVFALSDSIFAKQEKQAAQSLESLLAASSSDEKFEIIKIVGLLTEQLKSLLQVYGLLAQKKNQAEIAEILGWSSGRVFVNLKLVKNFDPIKAKTLLRSLLSIDRKLKTSEQNPKLLLNLFIHQATQ